MSSTRLEWQKAALVLKKGGIVVIPTDTIYGVVASAQNKKAVERLYKVRGRDKGKPCIVLINSYKHLKKFGIVVSPDQKKFLESVWPGKVSVILPVKGAQWKYLHRGTKTIAFRMVGGRNKNLYALIQTVGPILAPSANPQGQIPAPRRSVARGYFGDTVDMYLCDGTRITPPSTLIDYTHKKIVVLREGALKIKID